MRKHLSSIRTPKSPPQFTCLTVLALALLGLVFCSILLISIEEEWITKGDKKSYKPVKSYFGETRDDVNYVTDEHNDVKYFRNVNQLFYFTKNLPEEFQFDNAQWEECVKDNDFFRMYADPACLILWVHRLHYAPVISIDKIVGAMTLKDEKANPDARDKPMSNGGVQMQLQDNITISQTYWKPCTLDTGHRETYLAEIVSFWIDRFLGFFHTPPVVPRYFTRYQLITLAQLAEAKIGEGYDPQAVRKINSFLEVCGSPKADPEKNVTSDGTEGALVAWSPFTLRTMTSARKRAGVFVRFSDIKTEEELRNVTEQYFNINADSSFQQRSVALEIITVHLYSILVGNLRKFDHNLFQAIGRNGLTTGPYVYIDNDRSQWGWRIARANELADGLNPLSKICKFPKHIAHRILLLRPGNPHSQGHTLGKLILTLSSVYEPDMKNTPLFTLEESVVLDRNIEYISQMIDHCVHKHGADNVFIPETWPLPEDFDIPASMRAFVN